MSRPTVLWFALTLVLPLAGVGCAHSAERTDETTILPATAAHGTHGARAGHGMHGAHGAEAGGAAATPAERWPADAPLVRGMARIRVATDSLTHAAHGHLDPAQIKALSAELKSAVETMFVECRLAPAPDAALHPLLARVLGASQALSEGRFDAATLDALRAVLADYSGLFDEAGVISADHSDSA
jgi:hypothetical protein